MSHFKSFYGRIGRQQWWLGTIVVWIAAAIVITIITMLFGTPVAPGPEMGDMAFSYDLGPIGGVLLAIVMIGVFWASLALQAKRWHDRDKSAWWILIGLVPIIGSIWALVELGFLKGTDGPNQYGPDPLAGS